MIAQESVFLKNKCNTFSIPNNAHWLKNKKWDYKLIQFIWCLNLMILEKEEERVVHDCGMFRSFWQCWYWKGLWQSYPSVCILHMQLWFLNINCLLQNMSVHIASTVKMLMSEDVIVLFFPSVVCRYLRVFLVQQYRTAQSRILLCSHVRKKVGESAIMEAVLRLKCFPFSLFLLLMNTCLQQTAELPTAKVNSL